MTSYSAIMPRGTFLFMAILAASVIFLPGVSDPALFPKWLVLSILTATFLILNAKHLSFFIAGKMGVQRILILVWLCFLPPVFLSENGSDAVLNFFKWSQWCLWIVIFSSFSLNELKFTLPKSASISLLIIGLWAVFEWVLALDEFTITHSATYEVSTSFGHRNLLAHWIILIIPLAATNLNSNKFWRRISLVSISIGLFLGVVLLNRTAWFCLAIYAIFITIFHGAKLWNSKPWRKTAMVIAGVCAGILILFLVSVDSLYTIQHHFDTAVNFNEGTTRDRWQLLIQSLKIWLKNPWFGAGSGMWKIAAMAFNQDGMLTESAHFFYQRPHNDYVWILSESGVFAAIGYAAFHCLMISTALKNWAKNRSAFDAALVLSWIGFLICSLTSYPIERAEFMLLQAILAGAVIAQIDRHKIFFTSRMAFMAIAASACLLTVGFAARTKSEWHYFQSKEAEKKGDYLLAYNALEEAHGIWLKVDNQSTPLTHQLGILSEKLTRSDQACEEFESSATVNPYHPETQYQLAQCALQQKDTADAKYHLQNAVKFTPRYQKAWLELSAINNGNGDWRIAFDCFLKADTASGSNAYETIGTKLAIDSLNQILKNMPDRKMQLTIQAIRNTPTWAFSLIKKCSKNEIPFTQQVYLDACYYMFKHCEAYDDCNLVDSLIQRYLPNGKDDLNLKTSD